MSQFSFQKTKENGRTVFSFSGPIDEHTVFPDVEVNGESQLTIDLNDVTYINSIGIKSWIQWIVPLGDAGSLELRRCPKSIIFQANMVKNFLPNKAQVSSFYLPLFCEGCDKEDSVLLSTASDLKKEGDSVVITADLSKSSSCECGPEECQVEPDVILKKYLRFYQR